MRFVIARRCSILLAGLLLLWASQASDTCAGAQDARDQRAPAVVAPAATSFFWYSPPLYTNSTPPAHQHAGLRSSDGRVRARREPQWRRSLAAHDRPRYHVVAARHLPPQLHLLWQQEADLLRVCQ